MRHNFIDVPAHALRGLHSGLVDCLHDMDTEVRDSYLSMIGGITFKDMMLALRAERLAVHARIVEDSAILGIAAAFTGEKHDTILFVMDGRHTGVDLDTLVIAETVDFDAQLRDLVGGGDR